MLMLHRTVTKSDLVYIDKFKRTMMFRADALVAYSDILSSLYSKPGSKIIKDMPSRLVSDPLRWVECHTSLTNITNIFRRMVLRNVSGGIFLSDSDWNDLHRLYMIHTSSISMGELPSKLNVLLRAVSETKVAILQDLDLRSRFGNSAFLEDEEHYLNQLEDTASWLSDKLTAYSTNRTTKVELSQSITQTMLSDTELILNHLLSAVERKGINPLQSTSEGMLRNVKQWYSKALNAIPYLIPFYDDNGIE